MAFSMHLGASVRNGDPAASMSVSQRIGAESALFFARIEGRIGNISFGRAFLVIVEVRKVEVNPHARRLG